MIDFQTRLSILDLPEAWKTHVKIPFAQKTRELVVDTRFGVLKAGPYPFPGETPRNPGQSFRFGPMKGAVVSCSIPDAAQRKAGVDVVTWVSMKQKLPWNPPMRSEKRRKPYVGETVMVFFDDTSSAGGTPEDGSYYGLGEFWARADSQDGVEMCFVRTLPDQPAAYLPAHCVWDSRAFVYVMYI